MEEYQCRLDDSEFEFGVEQTQICTDCGQELPLSDYYRRPGRARPYRYCRRCQTARSRAYRVHHPDTGAAERARRSRERNPERYAERDRRRAQTERFKQQRKRRAAAQSAYYKTWYAANRERVLALHRAYRDDPVLRATLDARKRAWYREHPENRRRERHRRAARLRAAPALPFTSEMLGARMSLWSGCWLCGRPFTDRRSRTVDHVKPLSKGGADILANLRPACRSCNSRKADKWPFHHTTAGLGPRLRTPRR
ncbi:HNH endonuclease signature motif containing protein [Tsukamurella sp. PLM1]|uniref:HNH endonuclease signature motif containing protein n=1 Tax=Tsukamurella sp. PLM1 TaxID=2929795 RepID=UPI00205A5789|nr:HNH endonuclease signature motif containing protein [Tsukamurella sp. PLM1]BDH59041.1 bacteriophage protein [Tsukamurella sp. PLM1]